ncbi:TonB-dependent receptor [Candidatus Methylopumilus planktonicus]|uniref:TonB-dependent receptor domain-containing protein n=2 Tax=Candidatus Methylopumilus planktonicus TaxID=1581557 RepID=UPI00111EE7FB|nr:TonB-dependent receptor [Candidatus Methylopumilus planktonicus]QDD06344.1 TonB-dependent receptor [Candidatus Methylopumilus planktonicus]QDD07678.1 TonB-dependent receptor [Candidatus Methylopumilus planktonicus]QDD09005.1 TonB-dependent receptor [Candidatus Methylopumilus planktonicus]
MKKIILPSLLMTQLLTANVFADTTLKTSDVFVTATRTSIPKKNVIADITLISEEEIKLAGSSSLPELLQRQPGIEISNNGGQGKVSTLFLRGASSTHSVILLDGIRIDSATAGLTAIENIPLSQIEKIEIVRGPASSLYGQDAIGGVIQIFTKKGLNGFKPYISFGYGKYNTSIAQGGIRGGDDTTSYAINLSSQNSRGFSAFEPNTNPAATANIYNLDKDGYRNKSVSASLSHKINEKLDINFQYFLSQGKNKYDNRYANYDPNIDWKNTQDQESLSGTFNSQLTNYWKSSFRVGLGIDDYVEKQRSISYVTREVDNVYKTIQNQITWQNDILLPLGSLVLLYDKLDQKINVTDTSYSKKDRQNDAYMIGYNLNQANHNFQANVRKDFNSVYRDATTGNIGYLYAMNSNWSIASSFGTAFRSPTFNYLYAGSYANPDLQPEKSKNIEAQLKYQSDAEFFSFVTFKNKITDFIISDGTTGYRPYNINTAEIYGATVSSSHFMNHFQVKSSFTVQSPMNESADKYLPRRSNFFGTVGLNYFIQNWNLGFEATGSGNRYNDAANLFNIPGYIKTNLFVDYQINKNLTMNARVDNVLGKNYTYAYEGNPTTDGFRYQTPSQSFFISLRYEPQ